MWNPLSLITKPLIEGVKEWNRGRVDLKKKHLDIKSAAAENTARLLRDN